MSQIGSSMSVRSAQPRPQPCARASPPTRRSARSLLEEAHRLRGDIHAIAAAIAHRSRPPPARSTASRRATRAGWPPPVSPPTTRKARGDAGAGGSPTIHSPPRSGRPRSPPLSSLTQRDPARIKECGGVACGWLFYDGARTAAAAGAKWRSAATAPSSGATRRGRARRDTRAVSSSSRLPRSR